MTPAEIRAWARGDVARSSRGVRVVVGDDAVYVIRGGAPERAVPGGHARPAGWNIAPARARAP